MGFGFCGNDLNARNLSSGTGRICPMEAFQYTFPQKDNSPIEVWKERFLKSKNYALIQEEI